MYTQSAMEVDPREDKLPKWAVEKLHTLRLVAQGYADEIKGLTGKTEKSAFYLERFGSPDRFYLPQGQRLIFEEAHSRIEITARYGEKGKLTVYSLENSLLVRPSASNVITVESEQR
jgi:hypothetical protein